MKFIEFCAEYLSDVVESPTVIYMDEELKHVCGDVLLDPISIFMNNLSDTSLGRSIKKAYHYGYGEKALRFAFDNADMEIDVLAEAVSRYVVQLQNNNLTEQKPMVIELFERYSNQEPYNKQAET